MPTLFLATKNAGKVRELRAVLAAQPWGSSIEVVSATDRPDLAEPEETGETFAENARLKARAYAAASGLVALADDSGLEVDALGGRPGVYSARYGTDDADRIARLLGELVEAGAHCRETRTARFRCAMALARPDGTILAESDGRLEGRIADEPRGSHGFGYDPVFDVDELGCRLAEAPPEVKNRISHRGMALASLMPALRSWAEGEGPGPLG